MLHTFREKKTIVLIGSMHDYHTKNTFLFFRDFFYFRIKYFWFLFTFYDFPFYKANINIYKNCVFRYLLYFQVYTSLLAIASYIYLYCTQPQHIFWFLIYIQKLLEMWLITTLIKVYKIDQMNAEKFWRVEKNVSLKKDFDIHTQVFYLYRLFIWVQQKFFDQNRCQKSRDTVH